MATQARGVRDANVEPNFPNHIFIGTNWQRKSILANWVLVWLVSDEDDFTYNPMIDRPASKWF